MDAQFFKQYLMNKVPYVALEVLRFVFLSHQEKGLFHRCSASWLLGIAQCTIQDHPGTNKKRNRSLQRKTCSTTLLPATLHTVNCTLFSSTFTVGPFNLSKHSFYMAKIRQDKSHPRMLQILLHHPLMRAVHWPGLLVYFLMIWIQLHAVPGQKSLTVQESRLLLLRFPAFFATRILKDYGALADLPRETFTLNPRYGNFISELILIYH